jgi:hypothetical protein
MYGSSVNNYGSTQVLVSEESLDQLKSDIKDILSTHVQSYVQHAKEKTVLVQKQSQAQAELEAAEKKAQASREEARISRENLNSKTTIMIASLFCAAFGKKLDPAQASQTVARYALDRAISLEIEKRASHVISTSPFIQYLKEHSEATSCNFKLFTTVADVKNLAQYLQDTSCAVQTVIMKNSITAAEKACLATAVANRPALKVTYV